MNQEENSLWPKSVDTSVLDITAPTAVRNNFVTAVQVHKDACTWGQVLGRCWPLPCLFSRLVLVQLRG